MYIQCVHMQAIGRVKHVKWRTIKMVKALCLHGIYFCDLKMAMKFAKINPSQTLMNLQH